MKKQVIEGKKEFVDNNIFEFYHIGLFNTINFNFSLISRLIKAINALFATYLYSFYDLYAKLFFSSMFHFILQGTCSSLSLAWI